MKLIEKLPKKKASLLIFIVLSFLSLVGCPDNDGIPRHFNIINNSNRPIYYAFSYSFPDTAISKINNVPYSNGNKTHKINSFDSISTGTNVFELNTTTLMFIFDAELIENTSWDSIIKYNYVLKRYQLTLDDLEKDNWVIKFP
jgi:hypothetical protein